MKQELIFGTLSVASSLIGVIAQTELPSSVSGLMMQFGGLGLAVWLVYHHTTITIPGLQKEFRDERLEMLNQFEESLKEKREAYFAELARLRDSSCRYMIEERNSRHDN